MTGLKRFFRDGYVFSAAAHLGVLLIGLLVFGGGENRPAPPEPMAVELVPPEEAPPPPHTEPSEQTEAQHVEGTSEESTTTGSEAQSDSDKGSASAESRRPKMALPAPQADQTNLKAQHTASLTAPSQATSHEEPQPETQPLAAEPILPPDATKDEPKPQSEEARTQPNPGDVFALPLTLPGGDLGGGYDLPSATPAKAPHDDTAAFRAHVGSCSHLPPDISSGEKVQIVIRVFLKRDGTLAAPPEMLDATLSPKSSVLMKTAVSALEQCQPFTELPKEKYKQWKMMDLIVTPRALAGG
jgi:hypothetical protein